MSDEKETSLHLEIVESLPHSTSIAWEGSSPYPWVPCLKIKSNCQCLKHSCAQCICSFPLPSQSLLYPEHPHFCSHSLPLFDLCSEPVTCPSGEILSRCDQGQCHLEERLENAEMGRPDLQTSGYTPTSTSWGYSEYIDDHAGQGHDLCECRKGKLQCWVRNGVGAVSCCL